ncbi:inosine monophosphate dehydrogenase [Hortaea werneckii]|nr:inosine monophosphate dehydrogenase [Hortaea werneckii]
MASTLSKLCPWVKMPLVVSAPMLGAATPALAVAVSRAGGIGFIAGGTKFEDIDASLKQVSSSLSQRAAASPKMTTASAGSTLPIGVGYQLWGCKLSVAVEAIKKHLPAIAWLFAPKQTEEFATWSQSIRQASDGRTQVWVQVGSVAEARLAVQLGKPDVVVVQGSDAGGHGFSRSASVVSLVPEVLDMLDSVNHADIPVLAAGGITDGRGVAAAVALGATGAVMGTRFLAAQEAGIAKGWQNEIIRASDGGQSTNRSTLCDRLKETKGWPSGYDGRAIENKGHEDEKAGMPDHENIALYKSELAAGDSAWGLHGRMVAYSGTGVGLVHGIKPAAEIVSEVHEDASKAIRRAVDLSVRERSRPNKL